MVCNGRPTEKTNLPVAIRVYLAKELKVARGRVIDGKSRCRTQSVNLADLETIYVKGEHDPLNRVNSQRQAPTEVDVLNGRHRIRIQQCLHPHFPQGVVPLKRLTLL